MDIDTRRRIKAGLERRSKLKNYGCICISSEDICEDYKDNFLAKSMNIRLCSNCGHSLGCHMNRDNRKSNDQHGI